MNAPVGQLPTDEQQSTFLACMADVNEGRRTGVVVGVVALLLGGVVAYVVAVACAPPVPPISRRRRARTVGPDQRPERRGRNDLAARASVAAGRTRALGLAFGPPGRRELAFTGGLVPLAVRDRPAFRSIVLHELAHIRNRDVDLAYYAIGIWRALVVVAIIPFVVTLLDELLSDPGIVGSFGWRLLALVPLVYLVRAGILRAREHDADVRASTREPEIRRVLGAAADRERPTSSMRALPKVVPAGFGARRGGDNRVAPHQQPARGDHRRPGPAPSARVARRPGCRHRRVAGVRGGRHPRGVLRARSVHDAWAWRRLRSVRWSA